MEGQKEEQEIPKVWGSLRHVFNPAILSENQIHEKYLNMESSQVLEASQVRTGLVGVIQRVQGETDIRNPLDATQEQRDKFIAALKSDSQWFDSFTKILGLFDISADPKEVVKDIHRPWFNALQVNLSQDSFVPEEGYSFTGKVSHSFIAQLGDVGLKTRGKLKYDTQTKFQPVSVSNVLLTSDGKLVLGYRGGQNYPDVLMTLPAGSAEPRLKRGAAFGSLDLEHLEELNLTKSDYSSAKFVGVATESLLARGGWHYWIFRTETPMTSGQLITHWQNAVDKKEHRNLEVYDNDPEAIIDAIRTKSWDIRKAQDPYLKTTAANIGTWLPQCSISVLGSYVQEHGYDFAKHAQEKLENRFDLTSCFERE